MLAALGVAAIACTRAGVAPGLSRETAPKLTLGMSGEDVVALLGEPLPDVDPPDHSTGRLIYSRAAVLAVGESDFIMSPGLDVTVLLEDNALVSVRIIDTKRNRMCFCERDSCPTNWASQCLPSLPPGR